MLQADSSSASVQQEIKYSTCYMCACRCGIKVTLENNRLRFIQGTPDHPVNRGVLCAKGSAGIMKQYSRAKLSKPLLRKPHAPRGAGQFDEISWDEALDILTKRLAAIRATDPKKLAFFTGRDQMQALSSLWAQEFGTPNWAAHGGFCSVNMAAAGMYSIGYSFWEFGAPDWDQAKYFVLWGVAEDHASNPIKIGLEKLKRRGAKFVSINPIRTGYSAIADQWVPIRPGTDGLLALSIAHVLLSRQLIDQEFLLRYTNAPWLVVHTPGQIGDGLFLRDENGRPQVWDQLSERLVDGLQADIAPALLGSWTTADGQQVKTVFSMLVERYLDRRYAPENVAQQCGVDAPTIERLALEMAQIAFNETIELPIAWTDCYGRKHEKVIGRPVAIHAMRGVSAHRNGFQTCRAIHLLQMLLGALDGPGNFRARAPFPKPIPPQEKPERGKNCAPHTALSNPLLGFPSAPEDLAIDDTGKPLRIDKAFSWEAPLAIHGLLQRVISNAVNGDPYPIDTLLLFMANLAWNSSMNTPTAQQMLCAKDEAGDYKIPFLVVVDAFHSETVSYADLVLPDTTYFERYDVISLLDRPISEPDSAADAIRSPLLQVDREARPWQDVLIELAERLKLPAFTDQQGLPKYKDYCDFVVRYEKQPGIGFLAGWRGSQGEQSLYGAANPKQWEKYIQHHSFFAYRWPKHMQYLRFANRAYLEQAVAAGFISGPVEPIVLQLYSEPLQKFRLAGQGLYDGPIPRRQEDRERLTTYFDPLPIWYPISDDNEQTQFPFYAITQRPMVLYHSWDAQNAWLRQILSQNYLYINRSAGEQYRLQDLDWVWLSSRQGKIRCQIKLMESVEPNTVWTWNAVSKQSGTWGLAVDAPEANQAFMLNHLISEEMLCNGKNFSNADPITGQAAWFDLRVQITKCDQGATS